MVTLNQTTQQFIVHWGEMGSRWGINRATAQIHALLYISPEPLTAKEISETLNIARSTVSTGLHELQNWGIVKVIHLLGDRRDYFEVIGDVWEMFRAVLAERKRREIDPALNVLRETVAELEQASENDRATQEKMSEMLDFFETVAKLYAQADKLSTPTLVKIAKRSDVVGRVLDLVSSGS